jgi:YVTN family beta-propeller protein
VNLRSILFSSAVAAALLASFHAQSQTPSFVNFETPQVHPLDISSSGQVLVAVNTADNHLEVFDIVAGIPTRRGSVYTGLEPVSVRMRGTGEAWVVNQLSDSVSVVDLAAMRVTRTVRVGDEPADIIFAGTPSRAYVSLAQPRQIVVFDPTLTAPTLTTITIAGCQPRALAASPSGAQVYAAIFESGNRSVSVPRATVTAQSSPYNGQNRRPIRASRSRPRSIRRTQLRRGSRTSSARMRRASGLTATTETGPRPSQGMSSTTMWRSSKPPRTPCRMRAGS